MSQKNRPPLTSDPSPRTRAEGAFESWREEQQSAYLYRIIAAVEAHPGRQKLFVRLAEAAEHQAAHWAKLVRAQDIALPSGYRPPLRVRFVAWLIRRLGPAPLLQVLAAMKVRGLSVYSRPLYDVDHGEAEAGGLERRHQRLVGNGSLRAAVFGVNDGLISNTSLIMGVSGAALDNGIVLLTGVAGLLAGAASMAAGEYVSMRSQREMFEYQIALEKEELEAYPREEAAELALIYEARGLDPEESRRLGNTVITNPVRALDTLAREELGLNPDELGSPWAAAGASFAAFGIGAAVPLIPFAFEMQIGGRLVVTIAFATAGLFVVGALTSLFTGRSAWTSGARMVVVGAIAAAMTYLVGFWLGVNS